MRCTMASRLRKAVPQPAGALYDERMNSVFDILIPLALAAVLGILIVGVVSMLRGGNFNAKYSNKLMRMRVIAQLVAILLIGAFFLLSRH